MKNFRLAMMTCLALGAVATTGCKINIQQSSLPEVDQAYEEGVIMALEREWAGRNAEGDVEWTIDRHVEDGIQYAPGADPIIGHEALREAWTALNAEGGPRVTWSPTEAHVSLAGDMAWDVGTATLTMPDGTEVAMKYLVVWERVGKEWKIAVDMFNANAGE